MKNSKPTVLITSAITTAILALSATAVLADSAKILFTGNSHYYQRFDSAAISWDVAKLNCETLKGHLVTFPGDNTETATPEQSFVYSNLTNKSIVGSNNSYIQLISAIVTNRIKRRLAAIVSSFFQSDQRRESA